MHMLEGEMIAYQSQAAKCRGVEGDAVGGSLLFCLDNKVLITYLVSSSLISANCDDSLAPACVFIYS